jgi:hypothetical protein
LVKRSSELNEKENLDLTDKKLKTNNNVEIKTRKLKTIPIE